MSPDELSELAECLQDACEEAERRGKRIVPYGLRMRDTCCPLGALVNESYPGMLYDLDLPLWFTDAFIDGFDGQRQPFTEEWRDAWYMGAAFRAQYVRSDDGR